MDMFCFQCEQTAKGTGCTAVGVCGKQASTANLQDALTGKLVALARAAEGIEPDAESDLAVIEGLFTCITNVNFDDPIVEKMAARVDAARERTIRANPSKKDAAVEELDMKLLWRADDDIRSLKSLLLLGMRGMAAYMHHAHVLGHSDKEIYACFYEMLRALGDNTLDVPKLLDKVLRLGEVNFKTMQLLDKANTGAYGNPVPTAVPTSIEKGPFIVISGHDLRDLQLLLEQTEGKGVNIYTHGEMLPAHAYPLLKKHKHLKGNFGTAWQSQQREFKDIPAPVLFTTNCIMPVLKSYEDRIFTTSVVAYPKMVHVDDKKDFSAVIAKALELGGYKEDHAATGINGGSQLTVGFGHDFVLSKAEAIVGAVKEKQLNHIFLVGGCDGAKPGRNYYTNFVKQTPKDTAVLTLACGKYRFNDLDLGTVAGLPRIMDMGQCNDAYSAVVVAVKLAEAFGCGVNDLPLSIVLSWYEQKAVCVLLSLLHLGITNIYLGPTLPAFVSKNVLDVLIEKWKVKKISTVEEDMKQMLKA